MDEIFHTNHAAHTLALARHYIQNVDIPIFAKLLLNDLVVCKRDALLVDLAITAFCAQVSTGSELRGRLPTVDEFTDGLLVGVTICNKRLHNLQHLHGGLGHLDEDAVVDLEKSEKL